MFNIIKNGEIIDTKETLSWVKYQSKNDIFLTTSVIDGEGILVGEYKKSPIDPEDENSETETIYHPNSKIYIVKGRPNPKELEEISIKEIREEDEKMMADIDYIAIMTGVNIYE